MVKNAIRNKKKELQQEYKDLKYNPRELRPIGKEVLND